MSAWASVGASQRNLSIHEKCRVSQTQPDRPFGDNRCLIWLRTGPGYRATVVCSLGLQSWRYFLTKFLCHTGCCCRYRRKHGKFFDRAWIKVVGRHRRNHKCTRNYFHFYFSLWAAAKAEEEIKNSKASFPLTQRFCFIFCSRVSSVFLRSGRDFIWMH